MKYVFALIFLLTQAVTATSQTVNEVKATDTVSITQGTLRGRTDGDVTSFRGIPFAAPPVGGLRWRPPAAPLGWKGVRDATRFAPSCIQPEMPSDPVEQSEDCLNLNIWRPAAAKAGAKLPVMVWIYGGAFAIGSNALPAYDGSRFAERGVVLVNINYRLGYLGYFAHPSLTAENPRGDLGNYALMDAMAALRWVKANIAAFGGDPGNVTIFGESAGGLTVNALMTSPRARGLFDKAISQSAFNRVPFRPIRRPRRRIARSRKPPSATGSTSPGRASRGQSRASPGSASRQTISS